MKGAQGRVAGKGVTDVAIVALQVRTSNRTDQVLIFWHLYSEAIAILFFGTFTRKLSLFPGPDRRLCAEFAQLRPAG